jgi:CheY-like chemotaxis protein
LEVLEALHRQSYDVLLMDVQMPNMDGLATTRRICQECLHTARPRIIAMTANTMQGDREECLKAGMDDYISKPLRVEALIQALSKCQPLNSTDQGVLTQQLKNSKVKDSKFTEQIDNSRLSILTKAPAYSALSTPIEAKVLQSFRDMVGENADLVLAEMIDCYLEDAPKLLSAIATAVTQGDAKQLRQASHTLKSSSATLGAITLSNLCQKIEVMSRIGNTEYGVDKLPQLEAEYERVKAALQIHRQQKGWKIGKLES